MILKKINNKALLFHNPTIKVAWQIWNVALCLQFPQLWRSFFTTKLWRIWDSWAEKEKPSFQKRMIKSFSYKETGPRLQISQDQQGSISCIWMQSLHSLLVEPLTQFSALNGKPAAGNNSQNMSMVLNISKHVLYDTYFN